MADKRSWTPQVAANTRFPRDAKAIAIAAVTLVFPTPPLPVTKSKRREDHG
jgi:hypothetical protein